MLRLYKSKRPLHNFQKPAGSRRYLDKLYISKRLFTCSLLPCITCHTLSPPAINAFLRLTLFRAPLFYHRRILLVLGNE